MGAKWKAATAIILFGISACAVFGFWKYQEVDKKEDRIWHHELAAGADPTLGSDKMCIRDRNRYCGDCPGRMWLK